MSASEVKDFDEVVKNLKKEKKNELETFNESKTEVEEEPKEETKLEKEKEKKPMGERDIYFQNLNEDYAKTVRQIGQKNIYALPIVNGDGTKKDVLFSRKRLSVKELRWLAAKQKEYDEKPKENLSLFEAEDLASLYLEFAQMLLINNSTMEPITRDEFEQQDWGTVRSVVDNCILKSLVGSSG